MSEQNQGEKSQPESGEVPDENKLVAERRGKLSSMREKGNAFPNDFRRTAMADELHRDFGESSKEELEEAHRMYAVAGRLIRNRGAFFNSVVPGYSQG